MNDEGFVIYSETEQTNYDKALSNWFFWQFPRQNCILEIALAQKLPVQQRQLQIQDVVIINQQDLVHFFADKCQE